MKYAILADIHANLGALKAVLEDAESEKCDAAVCVGDVVGYGNAPKECVQIIRKLEIPTVRGNHDELSSNETSLSGFNPHAAAAVEWTRDQLSEDDRKWLGALKLVEKVNGFTIVHASLDHPDKWPYVFDRLAAANSMCHQTTPVCFVGHTHVPLAFIRDNAVRGGQYKKLRIEKGKKYLINVGSVGQPRDGDPKSSYAIYDTDKAVVELRRVDFDKTNISWRGKNRPPDDGGSQVPSRLIPRPRPPMAAAQQPFPVEPPEEEL